MKNKLFPILILISVSIIGCFQSNPSDVVVDFMDAVKNREYDKARELSTPETDKLINLQESISNLSQDSSSFLGDPLEIIEERIDGDTAFVKFIDQDDDMPWKMVGTYHQRGLYNESRFFRRGGGGRIL
jgi:hypothetical protein